MDTMLLFTRFWLLIANIGTAVLMAAWVWRSVQRRLKTGENA